ncbi:prenyltransferase/squalene oxidase repeat-containing protein [Nonomuraea rhizosphaerae]|uniref:prenyltransferase/squalene oxidase repeat-containing protein n=1 Tax=Nonomuraea rhizosphaerae TaxID=2665663 RepID=UPI001C5E361D|nr:prenyltransferase/squalene oxidase repeat-containing protein [Nonomuraea rhizosphaerae]
MNVGHVAAPGAAASAMAADALLADLMFRPWGQVSPSVYETGRLVTLAPWLTGHHERIAYLVDSQGPDGAWGAPDGYGLVPTLSATEAFLAALRRDDPGIDHRLLVQAVKRGLRTLITWLNNPPGEHPTASAALPDTPAIEHIVPSLICLINRHLDGHHPPLPLPDGMSYDMLALVRSWIGSGAEIPEKLLHALEICGTAASGASAVRPTAIGTVGASPAATAAWLGERGAHEAWHPARGHLEAVARRHGGPVPVGVPITVFERGWVLSWLLRAGVKVDAPPEMVADLRAAIGPAGTPAGSGLPADADTTAVALYTLALLGMPYEPDSLWAFHAGTHFSTWPGEQGASVSVNAHVLDAFGQYVARRPEAAARYGETIADVAEWIRDRQGQDGSWADRWHASPYYATVSCALALGEHGGDASAGAVRAAVEWVLATQRPDGSWGRWSGTAEETAYAMQVLLLTSWRTDPRCERAADLGLVYLSVADGEHPPLWHDKDLYAPIAVIRAAVIAAAHLAGGDR